jgi:hypothetical protein
MRNNILVIAAVAAAISTPMMTASAQTVGVVPGGRVIVEDDAPAIAAERWPAFREYVVRERTPNYAIPGDVAVGAIVPETGVTFYDVPQSFAVTPYRYTVVNGETVLVEPRTRRIVQVID